MDFLNPSRAIPTMQATTTVMDFLNPSRAMPGPGGEDSDVADGDAAAASAAAAAAAVGSGFTNARLKVADWIVIGIHLILTVGVGVLVSLTSKTKDKMTAGRSMNGLVVGLSMLSGLVSGISFIGLPGYTLGDGIGVVFLFLGYFLSTPVGSFIIIPFFHRLQLTTAYEYLSLRFSKTARIIGSFLFITRITLYLGVVLYAPALIIETSTGVPLWSTILGTGLVATLWTLKGGMVAVIYTDAVQSVAMIIGVLVCTVVTVTKVPGGFGGVFEALYTHSTNTTDYMPWKGLLGLHPTQTQNPGESFWAFLIGTGVTSLVQTTTDQLAVQRYMTAKNLRECITSFITTGVLNSLMSVFLGIEGVCILAYYLTHGDSLTPMQSHNISSTDHLLPWFALTVLPAGVAGLLLAAVVGSTMSVFSGGINAAATAVHIDIISYLCHKDTGVRGSVLERRRLMLLTICFSCGAIGIAFLASVVGGVVTMSNLILGICGGPLLGVFLLGMLTERAGPQSALVALVVGPTFMLYFGVSQFMCPHGAIGGSASNTTLPAVCTDTQIFTWYLMRINTWWCSAMSFTVTLAAGLLAMLCLDQGPRSTFDPARIRWLTVWSKDRVADEASARPEPDGSVPLKTSLLGDEDGE